MDREKLRNLVFERHGQRLDVNDPVFALVALNETVLEEATKTAVDQLHAVISTLVRESENSNKALVRALDDARIQIAIATEGQKKRLEQRTEEMLTVITQHVGDTVNSVVHTAMTKPVADAVGQVDLAARGFNAAQIDLETAKRKLLEAASAVEWKTWKKLSAIAAAAAFGSLVTGILMLTGLRLMLPH